MEHTFQHSVSLQVREFIRTEVEEGKYSPGMMIPTENELAELYGVQKKIVHDAVNALVKEGLLRRVSEKEVYVVGNKIERDMEVLEGFTQTMIDQNMSPSFKVISKVKRKAGGKFAAMFGIQPDDKLFYIKRLCMANSEPISLEETYIPEYLIPKMEGIDLSIFSVYEIYEMYGIHLAEAKQTLDLVIPNSSDARILGLEADSPVMLFQCITYDEEGRVIEFNRNCARGDKCNYNVHFVK